MQAITKAKINELQVGFHQLYDKGWSQTEPWGPKVAMEVPSTTSIETYGWMARIQKFREWIGPRQIQNLNSHAFQIENKTFELTVGVDANHIEDDKLGVYNARFDDMGRSARKLPDQQLKAVLQAGTTGLGFDGVPFFSTAHPLNPAGNQSNLFAGNTLSEANFTTAWSAMASFTGEDGEPLGVMPNLVIVPPQLRDTAFKLLKAASTAAGATNVQNGLADVLVVPELAASPATWYLADVSHAVKPLVWQLRRAIRMVSLTDVTDANVFMHREFLWGADGRGAASYGPWFLMSKNN